MARNRKIKGTMQLTKIKEALDLQIHKSTKIKIHGQFVWIVLAKFLVRCYNHPIYGISRFTKNKGTINSKLWKALMTEKNKA